jgi:DNA repair ATPase RecN
MAKRNSTSKLLLSRNLGQARDESRQLEDERKRLFEAIGIIQTSRHALASLLEDLDQTSVIDALQAASTIIDGVAAALAPQSRTESAAPLVQP